MVLDRNKLRDLIQNALRKAATFFYAMLYPRHYEQVPVDRIKPKRILLLNGAHIGDVVISTSIIPILRSAYPCAEIGFVVGSWSSMVVKGHPDITFVHLVDHWNVNRNGAGFLRNVLHYWKTYRTAQREIRSTNYDLALCIFPYFLPDYMNLARRARIPIRLGFSRSLFASLATAVVEIPQSPFAHQGALQAEVLRPLRIAERHLAKRQSVLAPSSESASQEVLGLFAMTGGPVSKYYVVHMGSGALNRELSTDFWREIATQLMKSHTLVFTGRGKREAANIARVIDGLPNCINACDSLSWNGFVAAIRNADALYGVESMAGHVAAAVGTRSIMMYSGVAGAARWRPEGERTTVFTNHLKCSPCGNMSGCKEMACLPENTVFQILSVVSDGKVGSCADES